MSARVHVLLVSDAPRDMLARVEYATQLCLPNETIVCVAGRNPFDPNSRRPLAWSVSELITEQGGTCEAPAYANRCGWGTYDELAQATEYCFNYHGNDVRVAYAQPHMVRRVRMYLDRLNASYVRVVELPRTYGRVERLVLAVREWLIRMLFRIGVRRVPRAWCPVARMLKRLRAHPAHE